MSGQAAAMTRESVVSKTRAIEYGPNKTQSGNSDPNAGTKSGMDVCVHTPSK